MEEGKAIPLHAKRVVPLPKNNGNPEIYLPQLIEEISAFGDKDNLRAVIIGGDKNHFQRNKKTLRQYGITIIGEYCDEWMDGERLMWQPGKVTKADKHLVVIPNPQEVLMYSKAVGYIRLYPPKA